MMIELNEQQRRALNREHEYPAQVVNPQTQEVFFLLPAELFERARAFLEEEDEIAGIEEMYPLVNQVLDDGEKSAKESA